MNANKDDGAATNLERLDAHIIGRDEYDDIPELTGADFARGTVHVNGVPVRRGRPAPDGTKLHVTLRLDRAVAERFKAGGAGWQSRINAALKGWLAGPGRRG